MEKPALDIEMMKRLYDWGGLFAYRVETLDPITWTTRTEAYTFNEEEAKSVMKRWQEQGIKARMFQYLIKFDGEFSYSNES